jgi:hypothetical protein
MHGADARKSHKSHILGDRFTPAAIYTLQGVQKSTTIADPCIHAYAAQHRSTLQQWSLIGWQMMENDVSNLPSSF